MPLVSSFASAFKEYKVAKSCYLLVQIYAPSYNAPNICPNVLAVLGIFGKDYYSDFDKAGKFDVDTSLSSNSL